MEPNTLSPKWWQTAVFYQIYPRSFADGNGDGIGDLEGIIHKLDYLRDLGIDALWLSPHYPSPLLDCGYDIADYIDVASEYGKLETFVALLEAAHARGIRIILDLVLNHTSHEHAWFKASSSSRDDPKRDWYIWRDGRDGGPPNNWISTFGGSAWELDLTTGQYYYHFFLKEQPDLNWRNPEVKAALFDAARFWLDLGVDGFRLDAIDTIYEDPALPDHTCAFTQEELWVQGYAQGQTPALQEAWDRIYEYQLRQPGIHALFRELRQVIDEYEDRVLVGETDEISFYGNGDDELHLVFNFPLMRTNRFTPAWIHANQRALYAELPEGAWPCNTLGNHDTPRVFSRYSDGEHDVALARLSLALMLTLRGTPILYNGEEIGMTDYILTDLTHIRDTVALWHYDMQRRLLGKPHAEALLEAARISRDKCRTPMQWANAPHGGFCPPRAIPWLPVNPNYAHGVNVAGQERDPASLLSFYRRMLVLRKRIPALSAGDYTPRLEEHADCFCFLRAVEGQTCLVVLNFSAAAHTLAFEGLTTQALLYSSAARVDAGDVQALSLAPFEIYIAELYQDSYES